jgi:hypothetical protein
VVYLAKKAKTTKIGSMAFVIGVIIAIIAGFWPLSAAMTSVLILLGIIVGILNVTAKETTEFLLASVSLVIVTALSGEVIGKIVTVGATLSSIYSAILVFVVPATIIVALKAIYALAKT